MAENKTQPYDFTYNYGSIAEENAMEAILSMARELASSLAGSAMYSRYKKAARNISRNDELNNRLMEYKRVQLDFEMKYMQGIEPPFSEEQYLSKLYAELMLNDETKEFLLSEREMLALIKQVNGIMLSECRMDLDFLDK